ncbi:OPT oligopeptide transporter family [Penicillium sp. IBT 18751x]|nr:OPT oligopeptide transporter family [Penicillium sp. IBT 18751x]
MKRKKLRPFGSASQAFSFAIGCITAGVYDTEFPIWGIVVGVLLCLVLQRSYGMVYTMTDAEVTNNVIAELIAGYAIPSRPIGKMIFKTNGGVSCVQRSPSSLSPT